MRFFALGTNRHAGDLLSHLGERHQLVALLGFRFCLWLSFNFDLSFDLSLGFDRFGFCLDLSLGFDRFGFCHRVHDSQHVILGHAPTGARALDCGEVYPRLRG